MKQLNILLILFLLSNCNTTEPPKISWEEYLGKEQKRSAYFQHNKLEEEVFIINTKKDTTLLTSSGVLISIPANNFRDKNGKDINTAQLAFIEVFDTKKAIENGLSTIDTDGNVLKTSGMFFFNFKSESGEALELKKPVIAQTYSNSTDNGLALYKGTWDNENIEWNNPKPLESKMEAIPLEILYEKYNYRDLFLGENGYSSYQKILTQGDFSCYIDNLLWQIQQEPNAFQNTWIATREFKTRMMRLKYVCSWGVEDLIMANLDKDLWEVDQMIAEYLEEMKHPIAKDFRFFAQQRCTTVDTENLNNAYLQELQKQSAERYQQNRRIDKVAAQSNYPVVFNVNENGWYNLDCILPSKGNVLENIVLKFSPDNIAITEDHAALLYFKGGKSAILLKTTKEGTFQEKFAWLPKGQAFALVIKEVKTGEIIAWQEGVIEPNKDSYSVNKVEHTFDYNRFLSPYLLPERKSVFSNENKNCCI